MGRRGDNRKSKFKINFRRSKLKMDFKRVWTSANLIWKNFPGTPVIPWGGVCAQIKQDAHRPTRLKKKQTALSFFLCKPITKTDRYYLFY